MKNFILGVGEQKSGSNWLHGQLMKNESIHMGFAKEYHTFDAISYEHCSFFRTDWLNTILEKEKGGSLGATEKAAWILSGAYLSLITSIIILTTSISYIQETISSRPLVTSPQAIPCLRVRHLHL